MADSVLRKNRDYSSDMIDEDDPLMELSRIIGLEPRREQPLRREPEVILRNEPARPEPATDLVEPEVASVDDEPLLDASAELSSADEVLPEIELSPLDEVSPEVEVLPEVELSDEIESIDDFQLDLADELIASLEAEAGYSASVNEPAAQPEAFAKDEMEVVDDIEPGFAQAEDDEDVEDAEGETVPHLAIHASEQPSIEDELQALLDASNDRKSPLGLRPVDQGIEDVEPIENDFFSAFSTHANTARPAYEPIDIAAQPDDPRIDMNFDADPESDELAEPEWDLPEDSEEELQTSAVRADSPAQPAEMVFEPEELVEEPDVIAATDELENLELPFQPLDEQPHETAEQPVVEAIQHEARSIEATDEFDVPEFEYEEAGARESAAQFGYDDEYSTPVAEQAPTNTVSEEVTASVAAAEFDEFELDQINDAIAELEQERAKEFAIPEAVVPAAATLAAAAATNWQKQARAERQDFVLERGHDPVASPEPLASRPETRRTVSGRGYLMAAGLGALALVGGIAAYALTNNSSSPVTNSAPVVLKADTEPVKIAPENPGGSVVPNQDIAVYDKVGGSAGQTSEQEQLVSATEQPVDLQEKAATRVVLPGPSATEPDELTAKSEERIDPQSTQDESPVSGELASVSPKRVRTLVVKPDGSLVERTTPAPSFDEQTAAITPDLAKPTTEGLVPAKKVKTEAVDAATAAIPAQPGTADAGSELAVKPDVKPVETAAAEKVVAAPEPLPEPVAESPAASSGEATETVVAAAEPEAPALTEPEAPAAAAEPTSTGEAVPTEEVKPLVKTVKTKKIQAEPAANEGEIEVAAAANVPLVEARPADQPVNIVAKTGKTPGVEAPAAQAAPAVASGNYVIQIASTPSPDAAQSTYATLSRKFASVIGGRGVTIQKADIPGKGIFYRVRIDAGSKKEAVALCTKYKAAGGDCLVAR